MEDPNRLPNVEPSGSTINVETPGKKKVKKIKKKKVYKEGFNWFFWICLVIILIPCCLLGYILLNASLETGTPILGSRFSGEDLSPSITESDMSGLASKIKNISGVENCTIDTVVATTRVKVDCKDTLSNEDIKNITQQVYETIDNTLPIMTYFTNTETKIMYDLEVYVYNNTSYGTDANSNPKFIMYQIVKNAKMENSITQDTSTALYPDLAADLLKQIEERDAEDSQETEYNEPGENLDDENTNEEGEGE